MKKLFTVLAVLLVASLAFAGFSGEVAAKYTFNFDERTVAYGKPGMGAVDATFNWDSQSFTIGEEDGTHIEVALAASFEGFYNLSSDHADGYDPYKKAQAWAWSKSFDGDSRTTGTATRDAKSIAAGLTLKVATFKIVAENWSVDFLSDVGLDFAKSAIDSEEFNKYTNEYNEVFYSMDNSVKAHDLKVTAFGYQFGFGIGAKEDWTNAVKFALTAVTPDYAFGDVTLKAGAGYKVDNEIWQLAGSVKAAYATDKLAISGAYDALKVADQDFINNDLAVKFDLAPVTVDVYFANEGAKAKDKYADFFWSALKVGEVRVAPYYVKEAHEDKTEYLLASNYLSTQVVVDVARVAENVPVKVTLSGSDLINEDSQVVSVSAETTIVPNFKFGVYFKDWFAHASADRKLGGTVEFTGVQNLTLNGEVAYRFADEDRDTAKKLFLLAGASYAHELFTASASVAAEKNYKSDMVLGAKASVVSTALVKGAELSAKAYFNLNDLDGFDEAPSNQTNKLVLGCKVAF